jgi:hypothetical protein
MRASLHDWRAKRSRAMRRRSWTMKTTHLIACLAICAAAHADAPATTAAAGAAKEQAAADPMTKAMMPGENHRRLEPMVGTFDATSKFWMDPGQPPMESKATSVNEWVLGGRFVRQSYRSEMMAGGPFEGIGYTGYDNVVGKYVGSWMDTWSTSIGTSVGSAGSTPGSMDMTMTMSDPTSGGPVAVRTAVAVADADHHSFDMFAKGPDGKEFQLMHVDYVRRK